MGGRLNPYRLDPGSRRAMRALVDHLDTGPLGSSLLTLVYLRASQINACAFCLRLHIQQARDLGIAAEKLDLLAGWRDASCFTDRERAALMLTEALTRLSPGGVDDDPWDQVRGQFTDHEIASLLWAIGAINAYNRVNIAARFPPGPPTGRS